METNWLKEVITGCMPLVFGLHGIRQRQRLAEKKIMAIHNAFIVPQPDTVFAGRQGSNRNAFIVPQPDTVFAGRQGSNWAAFVAEPTPSVLTYQYRILATGVEGTTTDAGSFPAGSVMVGFFYS